MRRTTRLPRSKALSNRRRSSGDNAWMLVSAALVLMMTGPGLALFYGGLVRKKNVLGTMMQSFILMASSLSSGHCSAIASRSVKARHFFGDLRYLFLNGVGGEPNADYAATIPQQTFMVYQLMFAIITPALICGAFAERMRFSAMLLFSSLWLFIVYLPMAHMVWGKGGLLNAFLGGSIPCFDFAGGTVVHITSGFSALVCALYLGKRIGYPGRSHEAAQSGAQLYRRMSVVGRLVRLQRRQRAEFGRSQPAPLSRRTSPRRRARWAGWLRSGSSTASRAYSAGFREPSPVWLRSLRHPVS